MKRNAIGALLLTACMGIAVSSQAQTSAAPSTGAMSGATSGKATPSDKALAKAVRRALSRAQGVNVSNLFVRARGGAVTLSGTVNDSSQIGQAEQVTKAVPGVTSVSNRLGLFHGGNG